MRFALFSTLILLFSFSSLAWNTPAIVSPANGAQVWTGVTFDWNAVYQSHQYQFQIDTTPLFNSPVFYSDIKNYINSSGENPDTRQYMEDLFFGKVYYWRVRAWQTGDTSAWSSTRTVITLDYVSPNSPASGSETWASVNIDWGSHTGVNFYDLEVDTTVLFNSPLRQLYSKSYINSSSGNTDTEQYIEDLYFDQTYHWRVRVRNANDTSSWSSPWWFHTRDYVNLNTPSNGSQTYTGLTLDWYAHPGVNYYQLEVDTNSQFNSPILRNYLKAYINSNSSNTDTEQWVEDLLFNQNYHWRVRVINLADTSLWSEIRWFHTNSYLNLNSPSSGSETWNGVTLDWSAHPGVDFYDLQVDSSAAFNSPVLRSFSKAYINSNSSNTDTEQYIEDLFFAEKYFWRVRIRNAADTSSWTGSWWFTTRDYVSLSTPANGAGAWAGLTLDWSAHPGVNFYQLQVDTSNLFSSPFLKVFTKAYINSNSSNPDTQHWLEDIFFNQVHYWRVRVINLYDTSSWSDVRWFNTYNYVTLNSPASGSEQWAGLTLDWSAHPGVDYYDLQVDTTNLFNSPVIKHYSKAYINSNSSNTDTEQWVDDIFFGIQYYWRVRVRNAVDTIPWSGPRTFITRDYVSLSTPNDGQLNVSTAGISLDWLAHPGIDVYRLQMDTTNLFNSCSFQQHDKAYINSNSGNNDTRHVTGALKPNTVYFWRVAALNAVDASAWTTRAFSTGNAPILYPAVPQLQSPGNLSEYLPLNIDFNWQDAVNAFTYIIELDTFPEFTTPQQFTVTSSQFSISGLTNDKTWYWRVRSVRDFIYSGWSAAWSFTTGLESPSPVAPMNFMTGVPAGNVIFQWSIPDRAVSFTFELSKTDHFLPPDTLINQAPNFLILSGLDPDSRYYWRVKATDGVVESYWSSVFTFFTEPQNLGFLLDLKVFLEGPYSAGSMSNSLNSQGFIPLQQPYAVFPWNLDESWMVTSIPSWDIVDWILIELRDAPSAQNAGPNTVIARQPAFLKSDGSVAALNGVSKPQFNVEVLQNLFVVIYHRNHLPVMSSGSLTLSGNTCAWDFRDDFSKAYGGSVAHKMVAAGTWAMVSGDGNGDGFINNMDKNNVWKAQTGFSGYYPGDFNLNGQVENSDKNTNWKPNTGRGTQVP